MSRTSSQQPDLENDGLPDRPSSALNQQSQSLQGGSNFGDSSGPLFSMYSKIAEEEDDKMTDRWTKDADGILIFTGLFSASVAALLAVSIQDLMPNSQDTSAFYLEKIFEQLYLNVTPSSIPSTIPKPPPFSPPRYAIWVNSLWFLSLVISLTAALLATSLQQWARRYVRITQPPRCSPEKRARMRAFFADGVDKLHIPWAVEGLPALLHLSLFLFFWGLLILLFNINHTVFCWVIWYVGVFLMMYGWITLVPIFRHDSPYYAPLSGSAWLLYTGVSYTLFKVLAHIAYSNYFTVQIRLRFCDLRDHYYTWIVGGVEKAAEETAWKQSSMIDFRMLLWTLGTLGDDDLLEKFFGTLPGFFNSSLGKSLARDFHFELLFLYGSALGRFFHRTLSSNSILDSVKSRRLIICINSADAMDVSHKFSSNLRNVEPEHLNLPQSIETANALARWCISKSLSTAIPIRRIVTGILLAVSEHDDRWIALAEDQFGLSEHVLRGNIAHGDNSVLLSILIHLTHQAFHSPHDPSSWPWKILSTISQFDICHTVPGLQHEFCALWNEIVPEARRQGYESLPVYLLSIIRHAYIALHQGTPAALTAFSASTHSSDDILCDPLSYPFCTLANHRSGPTPDGPHPTQGETQPLRAITAVADLSTISSEANPVHAAAQRAEQTIITRSLTDLAITRSDNASSYTQPFPSTSSTTEPVQVTSLAGHSDPTQDLNPPIQMAISRKPHQSTLTAANNIGPDNPSTNVQSPETRETSHAASTSSLTLPNPDPILATVAPSTAPGLPSAVVSGLSDVSSTCQRTTSSATLSHPQENDKRYHAATPSAATYISEISSTAHSIPSGGETLERDEEATEVPPVVVPHFQSSPTPMPAPRSNVIPEEIPSFIEPPLIQSDSTSHALSSPSSSATAHSRLALQVTSIFLDAHVPGSISAVSGHNDTRGMDTPIPMELPHPNQSTAPVPGIVPATLPSSDGKNGRN